ncbi:hypothetical protein BD560DRAFT_426789 [Blakeslea trispora]|nr:hypothetical protein BD560DRAFT_426789 [Blakeslea trispora]
MPLTNEIMFIYQACRQLTNNMVALRNDVNTLKEGLAVVEQFVSGRDNLTQSSVFDFRIPCHHNCKTSSSLSTAGWFILSNVGYKMPLSLKLMIVIPSWRKKIKTMASWKRTIFHTGSIAVDLMINDMELAKQDWANITYRNLDDEFKKSCRKYLTTYLRQKRIPLDRCVDFWLENDLIKHYYQSKRQTKKRKISKETVPSFNLATNSFDAQSDFDINDCYEGSSSPQSPKRRELVNHFPDILPFPFKQPLPRVALFSARPTFSYAHVSLRCRHAEQMSRVKANMCS